MARKPKLLLLVLLLGVVAAICVYLTLRFHGRNRVSAPVSGNGGKALMMSLPCPFYSQFDAKWGEDELGESGQRLAEYGCTVCSASMALGGYGIEIDPGSLNARLRNEGGFTSGGLLIWSALEKVAGDGFSVKVKDRFDHAYLDTSLKRGDPIIAKVLYDGRIWHWVLIVGKDGFDYVVADPLGSVARVNASDRYPDGFYAIRHLTKG